MAIYLITSQEIKDNTSMGGNVDTDKYIHFVNDMQVTVLEPQLGTKLYDKILSDFDGGTLAGLYLQMFNDYIKPVLWHSVFSQYVRMGSVLIQNGGIYKHQPKDSEIASIEDISYVAKSASSLADMYIDRLDRFLIDQKGNIPEYTYNQDEDYDLDPNTNINTISGWWLGNSQDIDDCSCKDLLSE